MSPAQPRAPVPACIALGVRVGHTKGEVTGVAALGSMSWGGGNDAADAMGSGFHSDDASHGSSDSDVECVDTDDGTSAGELGVLSSLGFRQGTWGAPQAAPTHRAWDRLAYNNIVQGLSKSTWVVYPKDNSKLLQACAAQWARGDWTANRCVYCASTPPTWGAARRAAPCANCQADRCADTPSPWPARTEEENYVQELLPDTLSKCLEEANTWGPSIHSDILDCCATLMAALSARLRLQGAGTELDEGDLVPLLQSATCAVDATCLYHQTHKLDRLPDRLDGLQEEEWAASRDVGEELVVRGLNPNNAQGLKSVPWHLPTRRASHHCASRLQRSMHLHRCYADSPSCVSSPPPRPSNRRPPRGAPLCSALCRATSGSPTSSTPPATLERWMPS